MKEIVIKIADRMMELDMLNLQFDEMSKLIEDIAEIISAYDDSEVEEECPCVAKLEESINEQYESEQHA